MSKLTALQRHFVTEEIEQDYDTFTVDGTDYLVLTIDEVNDREELIKNILNRMLGNTDNKKIILPNYWNKKDMAKHYIQPKIKIIKNIGMLS